jgi:DNA-binding MarR family transcriptional regulator
MLHVQMELSKLAELAGNGDLQADIYHVINTLENMNDTYAGCKNRLASTVYDMKLIHMYKPELSNAELAEEVGLEESTVKKYLEEK